MAKVSKNAKKQSNKKSEKYNADNEIIIGVTTKPKEKVRVDKKATRTGNSNQKDKFNKQKTAISNKKNINKKQVLKKKTKTTEEEIKMINRKKIILTILILILLIICGTIYYLTTPIFNISSIEVNGNKINSTDTYISLSGINLNETNIFSITNNMLNRKLKENPYVENVEIKRKLPNVLQINVVERTVDYQIENSNKYIYLNNQGYLLEIAEEKQDVPTIKGLSAVNENVQVGQRVSNEDLIKLDTILKIVNYCKYNTIENKLTNIDASDTSNYILIFAQDKKKAYIGNSSSITEKMTAVANILKAEKKTEGIIHADEETLKRNRVYFSEEKFRMED